MPRWSKIEAKLKNVLHEKEVAEANILEAAAEEEDSDTDALVRRTSVTAVATC